LKDKTMKRSVIATAAAVAVSGAVAVTAFTADAHGPRWGGQGAAYGGPCAMDQGGGYGRGMMGNSPRGGYGHYGQHKGYGPQMGWGNQTLAKELTVDDVKAFFEQRMAWRGNPNVKLGGVTEKDANTIVAEIVTKEGSLVQRVEIDRKTGRHTPVQ
jgi:hypothetical protein